MNEDFPGEFRENGLGWQLHQAQQRIGEWFEAQFALPATPDMPTPDWQTPLWLLRGFMVLLVAGFMGWLLWQLYRVTLPYWQAWMRERSPRLPGPSAEIPVYSVNEWVERSRLARQSGNYRDACRGLYMAMLQHLNERGMVSLEDSRTDGEYRRLLPQGNPQPYQLLLNIHERLCFSSLPISVEDCDRCWLAYQEIERA